MNKIDQNLSSKCCSDIEEHECMDKEEESSSNVSHLSVFFYIPNVIDYIRYILVLQGMSFAFIEDKWVLFIVYYYVAIAMDVIDGAIARVLN